MLLRPRATVVAPDGERWEAISWFPARRSLTWTTDPGHVEQVVAELVAQLGQGQPPNPGNATSRP
jgi:hypothetical protein